MGLHPDARLNVLALFAGAAGLEQGAKLVGGFRTVCFVEKEPYAQAVLRDRMLDGSLEHAPIWDDVTTFDGRPWRGLVDVVAGGFPCQDLSVAGKRAGITGARSGLFFELARIVREVGPRYVLLENVPGLASSGGLGAVLGTLAEIGLDAEWWPFAAADAGAPHLRERLWIVGRIRGLASQSGVPHASRDELRVERERNGEQQIESRAPEPGHDGAQGRMADADQGRRGGRPHDEQGQGLPDEPKRLGAGPGEAGGPGLPEAARGRGRLGQEGEGLAHDQRLLGTDGGSREGARDHAGDALRGDYVADTQRAQRGPQPEGGEGRADGQDQGREEAAGGPRDGGQDVADAEGLAERPGLRPDGPGGQRRRRSGDGRGAGATREVPDAARGGRAVHGRAPGQGGQPSRQGEAVGEPGRAGLEVGEGPEGQRPLPAAAGAGGRAAEPGLGGAADGLAPGLDEALAGRGGVLRLDPWGEDWEEGVPRVAVGVPYRVPRLSLCGNGVVPQASVPAWALIRALEEGW